MSDTVQIHFKQSAGKPVVRICNREGYPITELSKEQAISFARVILVKYAPTESERSQ